MGTFYVLFFIHVIIEEVKHKSVNLSISILYLFLIHYTCMFIKILKKPQTNSILMMKMNIFFYESVGLETIYNCTTIKMLDIL